jgi:hypothetical protein
VHSMLVHSVPDRNPLTELQPSVSYGRRRSLTMAELSDRKPIHQAESAQEQAVKAPKVLKLRSS